MSLKLLDNLRTRIWEWPSFRNSIVNTAEESEVFSEPFQTSKTESFANALR